MFCLNFGGPSFKFSNGYNLNGFSAHLFVIFNVEKSTAGVSAGV